MGMNERRIIVEEVYCHEKNRGRLSSNIANVPLTHRELKEVEKIQHHAADLFLQSYGVSPQKITEVLFD